MPPSAAPPGPHPEPPSDLHQHALPIRTVPAGTSLLRIYPLGYSPSYFDVSDRHRFNAPNGEFGTLYAGDDDHCAFAETLLRNLDLRVVSMTDLAGRGRSRVDLLGDLRLVDLTGSGLAQIRADGRLTTGDYQVAQRWSLALHDHPDQPDGLMWRSRFDQGRTCYAMYDRARSGVQLMPLGPLDDPAFTPKLVAILDEYRIGLV